MSVINGYRYLINEGGVKSLWRGNGMNVMKIIPETALRFTFFEEVNSLYMKLIPWINALIVLDKKNCEKYSRERSSNRNNNF
jgi:hypothetical protein